MGMMALSAPFLPPAAIDLMLRHSADELIRRRTVWFPILRSGSYDSFLTHLRVGFERCVFPVYLDHIPSSKEVAVCGGVEVFVPDTFSSRNHAPIAAKWRRAMMKLTTLPKDEAQAALHDIPEVFANITPNGGKQTRIEIRLFEFPEIDQKRIHPVFLIRD